MKNLDELLEPIRAKFKLPALAGAIVRCDGSGAGGAAELRAIGAVGVRKKDAAAAVTADDPFHIGSCTKAMTATLIAMLIEQGRLRWDTTIGEAFPTLRERMHADYRDVTLEQLLAHRGGAPAELNEGGLWASLWQHTGTPVEQRQALLEGVVTRPPAAQPGMKMIYSNAGYAIAGHMAEAAMGRSWEDLMRTMLFEPLGMRSGSFGAPGNAAALDAPWGHQAGWFAVTAIPPGREADNPAAIGPAGTVHCTIGDWARFVAEHLNGARGSGRLLTAETYRKLHTPVGGGEYALGWVVVNRDWAGGPTLMHAGSNTMWFAVVWIAPQKGFAVLAATNQGGKQAEQACDEAASVLIKQVQGE
jgi:CubicO group peptidase (beta-lactamase class C family)